MCEGRDSRGSSSSSRMSEGMLDLAETEDSAGGTIMIPNVSGPSSIKEQKAAGSMMSMSIDTESKEVGLNCSPGAGFEWSRSVRPCTDPIPIYADTSRHTPTGHVIN